MLKTMICDTAFATLLAETAMAEIPAREFKVVGTWGNLTSWNDLEKPFRIEKLPAATYGKMTGNSIPTTEAGLKGNEVMGRLSLGVFEVAHGLDGYVADEIPAIEGVDLSGMAPDFA